MKKVLENLFQHKILSRADAKQILIEIGNGMYNEHEVTSFVTVYLMRSIAIQELQGFRDALLELCVPVDFGSRKTIDIVGTGGDGKNTFNISTLACFIVAGAGYKVAKHGNYGASTVSGSSNVIESLGYRFKNNNAALSHELDEANICFLHAPLFHPALKNVAPIRKNLGLRTFFNMLGPLVNPSKPTVSVIGVFNLEMVRLYQYILQNEANEYTLVHGLDGYDEISLTGDSKIISHLGEKIWSAQELGFTEIDAAAIQGGDSVEVSSTIFKNILRGEGTKEQNAVVLVNAAIALLATKEYENYQAALDVAKDSLFSGNAFTCLEKLMRIQEK